MEAHYELYTEYKTKCLKFINASEADIDRFIFNDENLKDHISTIHQLTTVDCLMEVLNLSPFSSLDFLHCSCCTKLIDCKWEGLKVLKLPYNLRIIYCEGNLIEKLELPDSIEEVYAAGNNLKSISFFTEDGKPTDEPCTLQTLDLQNNYIESLHFKVPESLGVIQVGYNGSTGCMLTIPDMDPKIAKLAEFYNPPRVY